MATIDADHTAAAVAWDLETLLPEPGEPGVEVLLADADARAGALAPWRGRIAEASTDDIVAIIDELAAISELVGRAGSYAGLAFTTDTADPARGALMQRVEERSTAIGTQLLFFELEWTQIDDARCEAHLADERLAHAAHHLRSLRRYRAHQLSEAEEIVLSEKAVTGAGAWSRLFDELTSAITVELDGNTVALEVGLAQLASPDRELRRRAADAVTDGLAPGLRTRAFIFNTLLADKSLDDRMRSYPSWISARNLSNEASDASVNALVEAVQRRYTIPHRWYALKARVLGVERLADYDRNASVAHDDTEFGWPEACKLVLDAYGSFSGELADVVRRFLDEPWIDAPVRPGKRGGAFCAYTVPSHHPYLLLNWTSRRRDVTTLAHELGHGCHAYLARHQGVFHQSTPLTLAETASVFGEEVTFGRLLKQATDPDERFALLAEHVDGQMATVFRQTAMNRFEHAVHTARRETGELSVDQFGEAWIATQTAMLGDAVELGDRYRTWWSYIPHFIHTPGYVYAYAYGQLLALSVYARYEAQGAAFVPQYLDMLRAGGSMAPEELGRLVGCDLADPTFWDGGLDIIERQLDACEAAAVAAGRIPA